MNLLPSIVVVAALAGASAPTQVLPAGAIAQAVENQLAQRLAATSHAHVNVVGRIPDAVLPAGSARIVVGPVTGRWPRAHVAVPAQLLVDDRKVRALTVWVQVDDVETAQVYGETYPAHAVADRVDVVQGSVDMMCCVGQVLGRSAEMIHGRLKHAVIAGQPVMATDFEPTPAVLANAPVVIQVKRGAVRLRTTGVALHDAQLGESVNVRADGSSEIVSSKVVDNQQVLIND